MWAGGGCLKQLRERENSRLRIEEYGILVRSNLTVCISIAGFLGVIQYLTSPGFKLLFQNHLLFQTANMQH